ncbi:MAG: alpha/beta hydrolase family protein [Sandaracinaceae bacterium]|nr:alpha/beta hydrolase family protein [Sandaracinaceae bacterium]
MGYGERVDTVIGGLSRLLHLRAAEHNTVADLERYLDLAPDVAFPAPPPMPAPTMKRTPLDRVLRSSTLRWRSTHEVLCPRYRRRHEGEYRINQTASMRWLRPDGKRREDCLVYVHGWLEPGSWAEETTLFRKWSRELTRCDLAHVALPFHGVRKPWGALYSGELFWTADLVRTVEGIRQAVHDVRSAIGWLRTQGYARVGVTGLSLGGAITMLLACLEPAPDYVIPMIGHLQLVEAVEQAPILWRMKHDLERWGVDADARRRIFDRLGWASYAPRLAPDKQLWIQAREDVYIDALLAERQWRAWGSPPILWIDGGHMTFPLHVDRMTARMAEHIEAQRGAQRS